MDQQLSAPKPADPSTPQPEEPLQINMPTPTTAMMTNPTVPGASIPASTVNTVATAANAPSGGAAVPTGGPVSGAGAIMAPQPQFNYNQINIMSFHSISQYIQVNDTVSLGQIYAKLSNINIFQRLIFLKVTSWRQESVFHSLYCNLQL